MISFLVRFTHEHVGFRLAELQSLLDLFRIKAEYDPIKDYSPQSAYLVLKLPSWSDAARVAERAMLIKSVSIIAFILVISRKMIEIFPKFGVRPTLFRNWLIK
jgi:hypothetical protein